VITFSTLPVGAASAPTPASASPAAAAAGGSEASQFVDMLKQLTGRDVPGLAGQPSAAPAGNSAATVPGMLPAFAAQRFVQAQLVPPATGREDAGTGHAGAKKSAGRTAYAKGQQRETSTSAAPTEAPGALLTQAPDASPSLVTLALGAPSDAKDADADPTTDHGDPSADAVVASLVRDAASSQAAAAASTAGPRAARAAAESVQKANHSTDQPAPAAATASTGAPAPASVRLPPGPPGASVSGDAAGSNAIAGQVDARGPQAAAPSTAAASAPGSTQASMKAPIRPAHAAGAAGTSEVGEQAASLAASPDALTPQATRIADAANAIPAAPGDQAPAGAAAVARDAKAGASAANVLPFAPRGAAADGQTPQRELTDRQTADAPMPAPVAPQAGAPTLVPFAAVMSSTGALASTAAAQAGTSAQPALHLPADGAGVDLPQQIVQAMKLQWNDTGGDARIRLQPDYLGELTVSIRVEQGGVTASLSSDTPVVREWIESHATLLRQGLADHGLQLDRLTVADEPRHDWQGSEGRRQPQDEKNPKPTQPRRPQGDEPQFELIA
jgi:DNA segregation ATPase FtsK/SpoIIIE, S-DNA-T family